jgi:hypothetical protein
MAAINLAKRGPKLKAKSPHPANADLGYVALLALSFCILDCQQI